MNADETDKPGMLSGQFPVQETGSSGEAVTKSVETCGTVDAGKAVEFSSVAEKISRLERAIAHMSSVINGLSAKFDNFNAVNSRILREISDLRRQVAPRAETRVVEAEEMKNESTFKGKGFSEKDIAIDKIFYSGQK